MSDREYPARPIVGVGAVILVSPDQCGAIGMPRAAAEPYSVVLIKRRFEPLAGRWGLPGGTVEVGETLEAAAQREILEETGLVVKVGPVIEVFDRILRDSEGRVRFHFVLVDYLCVPGGGRLQHGSDVDAVAIVDPARLDEYELTEKTFAVIHRALELATGP